MVGPFRKLERRISARMSAFDGVIDQIHNHFKLTHNHLSAIGGITEEGRIFLQVQERAS